VEPSESLPPPPGAPDSGTAVPSPLPLPVPPVVPPAPRAVPPSPWASSPPSIPPAGAEGPTGSAGSAFASENGWTEVNLNGLAAPTAGRRPNRRRLAAAGAAVAVLAGGLASVRLLRSPTGASSSAQAAVEHFIHSLEQRDLLGAVETFPKIDRELIAEAVSLSAKQRFSAMKDIDLHAVPGYTLTVTGLQTTTEPVTDNIAVVTFVAGHYSASADLREIYRRAKLDSIADQLPTEMLTPSGEGDLSALDQPIQLAAIRDGEGWHVSIPYTVAELVRRKAELRVPDPAERIPANGAGSPEEAARAMADALTASDWRRTVELLPNDEGAVLHDYGALIAEKWLGDEKPWAKLTALETHTKTSGKQAVVVVDKLSVELLDSQSDGLRSFAAERTSSGCFRVTWVVDSDTHKTDGCVDDFIKIIPADSGLPSDLITEFKRQARSLFDGGGFVTVQRDGRWFIRPYHTLGSLGVAGYLGLITTFIDEFPDTVDTGSTNADTTNADSTNDGTTDAGASDAGATRTRLSGNLQAMAAQASARAADATMQAVWADAGADGYSAITPAMVHDADPELFATTPDSASTQPTQASWALTGPAGAADGYAVAVRGRDGVCYLIRERSGHSEFGRYDATTAPCHGSGSATTWSDDSDVGWK